MTRIKIGYCPACGQLESMMSYQDIKDGVNRIEVGCDCEGAAKKRIYMLRLREMYALDVEVRQEADDHDDPDQGDVSEGDQTRGAGNA